MYEQSQDQKRPIDEQVQKNYSFWTKSYIFVRKTQIKTWYGIFLMAFFSGIMAALIWSVSFEFHQSVSASVWFPNKTCNLEPSGGTFSTTTPITVTCGQAVWEATYKWEIDGVQSDPITLVNRTGTRAEWLGNETPTIININYPADVDRNIVIEGKYRIGWFFWQPWLVRFPNESFSFRTITTCENGVKDSDETDIDCGGSCSPCQEDQACINNTNCITDNCVNGICYDNLCKELYPGVNDPSADRVNIVFLGIKFLDINSFLVKAKQAIDYEGNLITLWPSLMELTVYKDNKDKFNFWYVDQLYEPRDVPSPEGFYEFDSTCMVDYYWTFCPSLTNKEYALLCNWFFRSSAGVGGDSYNSVIDRWPYVFDHEFQHQFPKLADEYDGNDPDADWPFYPNCAPDLETAQEWWGDIEGQVSTDGLTTGFYDGCSYVKGNYRPSETSILRSWYKTDFNLVQERHIESVLSEYSGLPTQGENAMTVTLQGNPEDITSYTVASITAQPHTSKIKQKKNQNYTLKVETSVMEHEQQFDVYDYIFIDDFSGEEITGEMQVEPKETVEVVVPLGEAKYNETTKKIDYPPMKSAAGIIPQVNIPMTIMIDDQVVNTN